MARLIVKRQLTAGALALVLLLAGCGWFEIPPVPLPTIEPTATTTTTPLPTATTPAATPTQVAPTPTTLPPPPSAATPTPAPVQADESAALWREDLDFLVAGLRRHPNPFYRTPEADFDRAVADLRTRIPALRDEEIIAGFMRIVALVHDGHTMLNPLQPASGFRLYPLRFYEFSDDLFVVDAVEQYRDFIGASVVRVGNSDVERAFELLSPYVSRDSEMGVQLYVPVYLLIPELLRATGIVADADKPGYVLEKPDGERVTIDPAPLSYDTYMSLMFSSYPVTRQYGLSAIAGLPIRPQPLYLSARYEQSFWYSYLEDSRTLYVQYNFVTSGVQSSLSLSDLVTAIKGYLDQGTAQRVVVDVRHNIGGDNTTYYPFMQLLSTHPALARPGALYVIFGRQTFSAGMNFVSDLEKRSQAIFAGEPTGNSPNQYGDPAITRLPNSRFGVRISTRFWQKSDPGDPRNWQEPDLPVPLTSADFFAGRDPVLEAVLR